MYVGRSDRLKNRLLSHGQLSGGSETATFAFILAKKAFNKDDPMRSGKLTRPQLQKDPEFIALFDVAKTRVRKMLVRAVGIEDPIEQTIFEVYAHLKLRTPHNDFNNH